MGITISKRGGSKSNTPNASTRCKSRRGKLLDRTQLRQLIQQSPEQLASSVADKGYRNEIDLYSTKFEGSDLLEMALTHRLTREIISTQDKITKRVIRKCPGFAPPKNYLSKEIFNDKLFIETPQGLECFKITVPVFFGKDFEIKSAEKISL